MKQDKNKTGVFTDEERDAMRTRAKELAAEAKAVKTREEGERDVLAAIAKMSEPDRSMAQKVHEIVKAAAPELMPKTWYGMPAYANNDGKAICFYQAAEKFSARYAMLGFSDAAKLDEGNMWPAYYALKKLTKDEEVKIIELVKKAVD
jgi:uncharacterized protein YdhG (YjbR/CyaY superfamily)